MLLFPSPVGELHFSIEYDEAEEKLIIVSVPCRGTTFLNLTLMKPLKWLMMFPSPVGELHFSIPSLQSRHQSGLMVGIAWEKYFWKINKMHLLKSAANSVFKPCAAKSKQIFSFIKKYQFHIVPSYILFPDSGYISRYVVKPSFLYLYSAYDFVAHLFCQRYLLLFQYLLFRQT